MAGSLSSYSGKQYQNDWSRLLLFSMVISLQSACGDSASDSAESPVLTLPERQESVYITDQTELSGMALSLWNEDGGCRMQLSEVRGARTEDNEQVRRWLKPMAPCYFIKSPGTQKVQVFRQDKTTRVIAVLGTPSRSELSSGKRCGREVQGVRVAGHNQVSFSEYILSGSVYCADSGLDNFQYSLF